MVDLARDEELRAVLVVLAPGSVLREGIERIIRAGRGALMVIGWTPEVEPLVSGGFVIDIAATSQRIAELAKMDGALVLDSQGERILRANVHLVPDHRIETTETGTRHRSAERTARQTGAPVITVSESMGMVTLYLGDRKHVVEEVSALLVRANQALSTPRALPRPPRRGVGHAVGPRGRGRRHRPRRGPVPPAGRDDAPHRSRGRGPRRRARHRGSTDPPPARRARRLRGRRPAAAGARLPRRPSPQAVAGARRHLAS